MTVKEKIKDVLKALGAFAENQPELKISEVAIGGKVEVINADETLAPAPDGEYTTEDKDVITVKDGFIVLINGEKGEEEKVADEPAEELAEEEVKEEEAPVEADWKAEVDALKAETEALKAAVEELQKGLADKSEAEEKMSADFSKQLTDLTETLKVLSVMPAEFSKTSSNNLVTDSKDEKMKAYARIIASNKK
jgi:hypothetical protein